MRLSRLWTDERGSASLEFVTVGLVLLVPLVYLVIALAAIQAGALAAEGAARQAARVFVQSSTATDARDAALRAVDFALADHGVQASSLDIAVTCAPDPADCLEREGLVTVTVSLTIPLPLVPSVVGGGAPLAIPLEAAATQQVSRFWGAE